MHHRYVCQFIILRRLPCVSTDIASLGAISYERAVLFVPHGWNTAVGLAADLQLVAAVPVARWVEYITPAPYIEDLVSGTVPYENLFRPSTRFGRLWTFRLLT